MDNKGKLKQIADLHEWEHNPRNITSVDFIRLKGQIERLGMYKPLLALPDGTVLGGNMRLKALKELGHLEVWISEIDFIVDEQGVFHACVNGVEQPMRFNTKEDGMLEYALSDNDRAGYYDDDLLANLIPNYNIDWSQYSVDMEPSINLQELIKKYQEDAEVKEDEAPQVSQDPAISQLGQVYQLGRHRLMCGDATNVEHVKTLLQGLQPSMIFTDPPYGVDYQSRVDEGIRKDWGGIKNDDLKGEVLQQFLQDAVGIYGQTRYICCNWQSVIDFWQAYGRPNSLIVWDKGSIGMGAGYRNQHELILFYGKLDHNSESNVWTIHRDNSIEYTHPTQKPVAIPYRAIKNSSNEEDIVLDVFGGSGSTLIACEQLNRTCYMMELDPKYCDVIRKRYAKFIGKEEEWEQLTPAIVYADTTATTPETTQVQNESEQATA